MTSLVWIVWLAFVADLIFADPRYRYHPVRLIGHLIGWVEAKRYQNNKQAGVGLLLSVVLIVFVLVGAVFLLFHESLLLLQAIALFILYSCIGFRDLLNHAQPIYEAVENQQLTKAQAAVQMIVGRDAKQLNLSGVVRATIESLAENSVDGLLAVVFYFLVSGWVAVELGCDELTTLLTATLAALFYRIANTLDAMVGYKNDRYLQFGWASARLDDILNFIPARLSIPFFLAASAVLQRLTLNAYQTAKRDRRKHQSPNAGHPESVVAGALGIRLGGPTVYKHGTVEKPWLGDGRQSLKAVDIKSAERLVVVCAVIYVFSLGLVFLLV